MSTAASEPGLTSSDESSPSTSPGSQERLWTPWRMRYVIGTAREEGCIFCNQLAAEDDVRALILHRGEQAFVIMNLFPYNTGHVMIVPNAHISSPEDADEETIGETCALKISVLRALRVALTPEGFNLGLNIGDVAGAGVSEHFHEHVVPRWKGDANFMPILASTMVMPELLHVTYAKVRAELERPSRDQAISIVLTADHMAVLALSDGALPRIDEVVGEPLWRVAVEDAARHGAREPELLGWAGSGRAGSGPIALLLQGKLRVDGRFSGERRTMDIEEVLRGPDGEILRTALARLNATP